ncbi:N-acetylglucosamine-6-phosphate deacetylase [Haliovirga abyssi]|uniref:N-acetylglucosamine-6-phosphate deacetylase n=1 Tax=Haliovirga abyssi TaxID=2996794 RepID=A0AAU9E537_9FUSO|nr:N-acetylglucosamine-6-phosphate deacetylase [Haliovirga abyssi]BDU51645.1 N-acetylglucosamine-6-phosphate deacetylase [Haliovirga abyssi]
MQAIINGKIILNNRILSNKALVFKDKIVQIVDADKLDIIFNNIDKIDAKGMYVSPGFIDVHIHGTAGKDVMDGDFDSLNVISKELVKNGVTGFLATTMTMDAKSIYKALDNIKENKDLVEGAKILGTHLEGPFISPKKAGAQAPEYIIKPSYKFIKNYVDIIKIITYAPEEDNNLEFTKEIKEKSNIVLSIGHTNANYDETMNAINSGASHITHTFNAMPPLHHREPGVLGAAFQTDVTCEIIADTIHVNKNLFNFVLKEKGSDKIVLITDAMRAACLKSGIYDLGGQEVIVDETSARLKDGTLAGSILTLNKAVRNIKKYSDADIVTSVKLATINPAKVIGLEKSKGSLDINKDADIVIFDDNINVYCTIVGGEIKYCKK